MPCCRAAFKMGRRKEGRKEGLGKKEGTKTADYCRRRRRRRAAGDRVALSSWRSPGGRRISPRKTGHEKGQEGGGRADEEDMSLLAPTTFNKRAQRERQIVEIESC